MKTMSGVARSNSVISWKTRGVATGEARNEATRVVELLYAAKLDAFAPRMSYFSRASNRTVCGSTK